LDSSRLVRRATGRESVEVLGYLPSARRVLLVWIYTPGYPRGHDEIHLLKQLSDRRR